MLMDAFQVNATRERYEERKAQRERNLRLIAQGRYLAVDSPDRVEKFLARRGYSPADATALISQGGRLPPVTESVDVAEPTSLERVLGTNDLMGVAFLETGLQVARTVGRIWIGISAGQPVGYGTGFLVSARLLLTNHHVLGDRALARTSIVEFNYQLGPDGAPRPTYSFALDPDTFHFADRNLDYACVAVQPTSKGSSKPLIEFGFNPLIEEQGKAIAAQWVNIIQHPNGGMKQLALRENHVVDVLDDFLHYQTDTAPGSSGSPVYNDRWEVVALHHSGVWATNAAGQILSVDGKIWTADMGEDRIKWISNEGVRISKVIAHLRTQPLSETQRRLLDEASSQTGVVAQTPEKTPAAVTGYPADAGATSVQVSPDGTATWTIPLSVSVRLGGSPAPALAAAREPLPPFVSTKQPAVSTPGDSILAAAQKEFAGRADVLKVRMGYVFKNGWITKDSAIVVTVRRRQTPAALREMRIGPLPESFRGVPVEVTNPTIADMIRATQKPAAIEAAFGKDNSTLREEIKYFPPAHAPSLDKITSKMHVVAHVSPDHGWPLLEAFLNGTEKRLVVGMYDFGAPHILDAVTAAGGKPGFEKLTIAIQHGQDTGKGTKADDVTDDEALDHLRRELKKKFESAWVKIGTVNGWVARSYHIKVAVRDSVAFWLSSGNWQSSNQPNADPLNESPQTRHWLTEYNRDWHAIVEHDKLAEAYEAYLLQDFKQNVGNVPGEELALPDVLLPGALFVPAPEEAAKPFEYFGPFEDRRDFTVQPLLTPDNFHKAVLALIESADEELLIQNQTFNTPADGEDALKELVDAVLAKQRAGVKVQIIFRVLYPPDARENLTDLVDYGFLEKSIKVQVNCHTKGVIADRKRVLLGSQNWSNLGVSNNRDASLLFEDDELAKYFGKIFDHDWKNLAKYDIGHESLAAELTTAGDPTPKGMLRLSWKDYQEGL
jgi:V8-like Glu-specific endopeptidase